MIGGLHEVLVEPVGDLVPIDVVGIKIDAMSGLLVVVPVIVPHPELTRRDQHHPGTIVGSDGLLRAEPYGGREGNQDARHPRGDPVHRRATGMVERHAQESDPRHLSNRPGAGPRPTPLSFKGPIWSGHRTP